MNRPNAFVALLTILMLHLLSSCSVQKRTTASGWHVERSSRQAPSIEVHSPNASDNAKLERIDVRRLMSVDAQPFTKVQMSRTDKRLVTHCLDSFGSALAVQKIEEEKATSAVHFVPWPDTSTTIVTEVSPTPSWQEEVLVLLERARKNWRGGPTLLTGGVSWLRADKFYNQAQMLCVKNDSNLETVAPEALRRTMATKRQNRIFVWLWLGVWGSLSIALAALLLVGMFWFLALNI